MNKRLLRIAFIAFLFLTQTGFAQELYMPRNIKEAYEKGTRSMDGKPGKNYWQNHGKYTMDITVDAKTKVVSGTETIVYENNSNKSLDNLVIRFVNNLHKPTSPRGGDVSDDFLSSGLTITSLKVDNEVYKEDARNWGTVGNVKLKKAIAPQSKVTINIDWNYPLSKESGREGQIDETTFFAAYSYPRVSVFDDYNGWDRIPHTDRQEFYNDFNDYTYSVKAPKNYVVYATGDFLNPDEVLQSEFAARLKKSYVTDEILHIANEQEMKSGIVTKQNDWNVWKFEANNITDVCFGLSDHYLWDASSVLVDKKTNRRASVQAAYNITGTDFVNSVKNNQFALDWFSNNWPGIPYPYSKMTAFQGFADMEYPMMCNDSHMGDPLLAQLVQDHEVAHTYFPFFMGINETRYAFMDEGWATTFEYLIKIAEHGKDAADKFYKGFRVKKYITDLSTEEDQPIISMSTQVSGAGYGNNSYGKASLSYLALKDLLGDDLFK
ncbi:MAG: M1 family metallopeptidase, partial [Flavobacterium sp.]